MIRKLVLEIRVERFQWLTNDAIAMLSNENALFKRITVILRLKMLVVKTEPEAEHLYYKMAAELATEDTSLAGNGTNPSCRSHVQTTNTTEALIGWLEYIGHTF